MTRIRILASQLPRDGCITLANILASNNVPMSEAIALYRKVAAGEEVEVVIQHDEVGAIFRAELERLHREYCVVGVTGTSSPDEGESGLGGELGRILLRSDRAG